ncbi:hypothetical protein NLO95_07875 [Pseudomonas syringae]|nr:hypothetical protein [Pseudomonas syringae]
MKKSRGPDFVRCLIPMSECPSCHGAGLIQGVFHQLECIGCHSSGFVDAKTLEPLRMDELVVQLGMMVRRSRNQLGKSSAIGGAHQQYEQSNRRGPGGSHYTGD